MSATKKIPQWKLDMLKDAEVASELVVKKAEADKAAAEKAAREAELKAKCAAWHIWKAANPWSWVRVETVKAVGGNERMWDKEAQTEMRQVPNKEKCPYCGKD